MELERSDHSSRLQLEFWTCSKLSPESGHVQRRCWKPNGHIIQSSKENVGNRWKLYLSPPLVLSETSDRGFSLKLRIPTHGMWHTVCECKLEGMSFLLLTCDRASKSSVISVHSHSDSHSHRSVPGLIPLPCSHSYLCKAPQHIFMLSDFLSHSHAASRVHRL